jgi:molybdopterin-guanine dinucleotide biosynthesis protein A
VYSAAILAGGRATRFGGRDKSALIVDGRPILERQIAELSRVTTDILIVGANCLPPLFRERAGAAPRLVSDIVPGSGPLGGIQAALTRARGDAVFVAACDMPYLDATFVSYLLSLTREADAVVPRTEHGYHPLCAVYTRACLEPIALRLAERRLKMSDLLTDVRTRVVTAEELAGFDRRLLANVNTPAEYAGLESLQRHKV